jgi:hypothetical protein
MQLFCFQALRAGLKPARPLYAKEFTDLHPQLQQIFEVKYERKFDPE